MNEGMLFPAYASIDGADLRTYVCPRCDALETETVPPSSVP
jgi:hypothetical protein